ncbi:MAG: hypothetical protein ACJASL_004732, partial [Paraglaciecola sp.]
KRYKPFDTLASCVAAGGCLPNMKTKPIACATDEAIGQGRAFVELCDRGEWPNVRQR